ncbi:MAG TPA: DUF5678 domain-containing protein [Chloroflexota bacterium]
MIQKQPAELRRFQQDTDYLRTHWDDLLERYPEQWIAIYNREVVGVAPDFDRLLGELKKCGVPIGRARIEHMTRHDDVLILPS